jgi:hypothetical protein
MSGDGDEDDVLFDDDIDDIEPKQTNEITTTKMIPVLSKYEKAAIKSSLMHMLLNGNIKYDGETEKMTANDIIEQIFKDKKIPFFIRRNNIEINPNDLI